MALIKRSEVVRPVRKSVTVACEAFGEGAEVVVRQMTLSGYMELVNASAKGKTIQQIAEVLADCVLDANEDPVYSAEEWSLWGVEHSEEIVALFNSVRSVSGLDKEETAKN
jgi:hypothetical protein